MHLPDASVDLDLVLHVSAALRCARVSSSADRRRRRQPAVAGGRPDRWPATSTACSGRGDRGDVLGRLGRFDERPAVARLEHLVEIRGVKLPGEKSGCASSQVKNGTVVLMPATRIRRARGACARSRSADPRPTRSASKSSGRRRSGRRARRSRRCRRGCRGPPARAAAAMRPGDGRKSLSGSSA